MKLSDLFKSFGKFMEFGSHLHTTFDVFSAFTGKEPPEQAGSAIKGIYGLFGLADERALAIELEKLEKKLPGSRNAIAGFFAWHFKSNTPIEHLLKLYYMSKLRVFIAQMGSSVGDPYGTLETVTKTECQGSTTNTTIKKNVHGKGVDNVQTFLKMMAQTIMKDPQDEEPKYLPGYEKLLQMFKAFGYPYMPDGADDPVLTAITSLGTYAVGANASIRMQLTKIAQTVESDVRRRQQEQTWLVKLLKKL